jgi:hypothetical protein
MPVALIVATVVALLLQLPPGVALASAVLVPLQIVVVPVMAAIAGPAITVTATVLVAEPQAPVDV